MDVGAVSLYGEDTDIPAPDWIMLSESPLRVQGGLQLHLTVLCFAYFTNCIYSIFPRPTLRIFCFRDAMITGKLLVMHIACSNMRRLRSSRSVESPKSQGRGSTVADLSFRDSSPICQ